VAGLAKKLIFMGIAGTTALVGIASKAPAVAPAIARMGVSFGKIQRSLGQALAPAFERVAGWLDKIAVWVDANKEKIGEIAGKFLNWAEAVGEKLWPWLEKIGNWAGDHPGLFAGIVAGLALAPTVIAGISSIASLVSLLGGATVATSVLAFFGYLAAIAGAGVALKIGADYAVDKLQKYTGMGTDPNAPTSGSGQTLMNRLPQKIWSDIVGKDAPWEDQLNPNSPAHDQAIADIKAGGYQPSGATMSARVEENRRFFLLQLWDAMRS